MINNFLPKDNKITIDDYKNIDWTGRNYSEKLNFSKVKDLAKMHKRFEKELHGLVIKNAIKNQIFYTKMILSMPHSTEKIAYLGKKFFNMFVVRPLFHKDLRL